MWKTTRPVRLCYSREESILSPTKRHPFIMRYKHGARRDGTLVAARGRADLRRRRVRVPLAPDAALRHGPCRGAVPDSHVKVDGVSVLTNNPPTSAFRGFGSAQPAFAYESQMDEAGAGARTGSARRSRAELPPEGRAPGLGPGARDGGRGCRRRPGGPGTPSGPGARRRGPASVWAAAWPRRSLLRPDRLAPRLGERVGRAPDGRDGPGPDRRARHRRRPGGVPGADHGGAPGRAAGRHRHPHRRLRAHAACRHHHRDPAALHVGVCGAQGGERAPRDAPRPDRGAPRRRRRRPSTSSRALRSLRDEPERRVAFRGARRRPAREPIARARRSPSTRRRPAR